MNYSDYFNELHSGSPALIELTTIPGSNNLSITALGKDATRVDKSFLSFINPEKTIYVLNHDHYL